VSDDRDAPVSSRRRLSAATLPEVPLAKQGAAAPFAVDAGDPAPLFELANESGVAVPLTALRGGPALIVFGPASEHAHLASALANARVELGKHGGSSVLIVAGNTALAERVAAPQQNNVVVLADASGSVHRAYGVLDPLTGRPRVALFLVDRGGDVARVFSQSHRGLPPEGPPHESDADRIVRLALDAIELAR
jgi:peroxiredoxin